MNHAKQLVLEAVRQLEVATTLIVCKPHWIDDIRLAARNLRHVVSAANSPPSTSRVHDDDESKVGPVPERFRSNRKPRVKDDFEGCHSHD